eukprot:Rhum_TRINITY_DN12652_c0_g1::Rhum_TRINITY_DN12652_c0_g1_i1::g.53417::m.53417
MRRVVCCPVAADATHAVLLVQAPVQPRAKLGGVEPDDPPHRPQLEVHVVLRAVEGEAAGPLHIRPVQVRPHVVEAVGDVDVLSFAVQVDVAHEHGVRHPRRRRVLREEPHLLTPLRVVACLRDQVSGGDAEPVRPPLQGEVHRRPAQARQLYLLEDTSVLADDDDAVRLVHRPRLQVADRVVLAHVLAAAQRLQKPGRGLVEAVHVGVVRRHQRQDVRVALRAADDVRLVGAEAAPRVEEDVEVPHLQGSGAGVVSAAHPAARPAVGSSGVCAPLTRLAVKGVAVGRRRSVRHCLSHSLFSLFQ